MNSVCSRVIWRLDSPGFFPLAENVPSFSVTGDGDFMGIPSKVFERIAKSVKSFFYVRAPAFAVKIIFELLPLIGIPEFFTGRRENDLSFPVHGIKLGKIFPFKFIPEYPDRNEKLVF